MCCLKTARNRQIQRCCTRFRRLQPLCNRLDTNPIRYLNTIGVAKPLQGQIQKVRWMPCLSRSRPPRLSQNMKSEARRGRRGIGPTVRSGYPGSPSDLNVMKSAEIPSFETASPDGTWLKNAYSIKIGSLHAVSSRCRAAASFSASLSFSE